MSSKTEHFGGIDKSRRQELSGAYVRNTDDAILIVDETGSTVSKSGLSYNIDWTTRGPVVFESYHILNYTETSIDWRCADSLETVTWTRINPMDALLRLDHTFSRARRQETAATRHQETPQKIGPKSCSLSELNQLRIPKLSHVDFLLYHLNQMETLAKTVGLIRDGIIDPELEFVFILRFIESLEPTVVRDEAEKIARTLGHKWNVLKLKLTQKLANRRVVTEALKNRIDTLNFTNLRDCEAFLSDCSTIMGMVRNAYGDNPTERRPVIFELLKKIPDIIKRDVITKLIQNTEPGSDWETCLPFDELDPDFELAHSTISQIIREYADATIRSQGMVNMDQVRYSGNPDNRTTTAPQQRAYQYPQTSNSQWAGQFKRILLLRGKGCENSQKVEKAIKDTKAVDHKVQLSKDSNRPYYLLAYNDDGANAFFHLSSMGPGFIVQSYSNYSPSSHGKTQDSPNPKNLE